jgi:hypothetical protein
MLWQQKDRKVLALEQSALRNYLSKKEIGTLVFWENTGKNLRK